MLPEEPDAKPRKERRKRRWKLLAGAGAAVVVSATVAGALLNRPLLRCLTIRWSDMVLLAPGVYVQPGGTAEESERLKQLTGDAVDTISTYFGSRTSTASIVFCRTRECFTAYSGSARPVSLTLRTPAGDWVVIGAEGLDALFVTHELVHCELDARVGQRECNRRVPMWFQEGLAMVVSGDSRFSETPWRAAIAAAGREPALAELAAPEDFNRVARQSGMLAYGTAWHAVSSWYEQAGREGVRRVIAGLERGEDFANLYEEHGGE